MVLAIWIFQALHICAILGNFLYKKMPSKRSWHYLRIADWVYYLCGVSASVLSFGIIGFLEEDVICNDDRFVCIIFVCACLVATGIMIVQKIWKIQYNRETLIFRNSFGAIRKYKIDELECYDGKRLCEIRYRGKKVIQWDSMIMNTQEEITLCRFLTKKNSLGRKGIP